MQKCLGLKYYGLFTVKNFESKNSTYVDVQLLTFFFTFIAKQSFKIYGKKLYLE